MQGAGPGRTVKKEQQEMSSKFKPCTYHLLHVVDIFVLLWTSYVYVTLKAVSNATKCETWEDIQASHSASGRSVVVMLDDTYGIWSLLAIGLTASVVIVLVEALLQRDNVKLNTSGTAR